MAADDTELEAFLETVCQVDSTGHVALGESIATNARPGDPVFELLDDLSDPAARQAFHAQLEVGRTLGQGGMGLVRLARQRSMGREVAVKTIRPDRLSRDAMALLLREAWVTGFLEHPNIVPVYNLGADDNGRPVVVLKRIEGSEWEALLADPAAIEERFGTSDPLEWNLSILLQVMNAVRFAHSRGIVHRDLKPQNVMIGEFGEVYVLDWGIAVTTKPEPGSLLQAADQVSQPAGTPGYMAPEMLGQQPLTPRTDIYLLGAILYQLVTGRVPHDAPTIEELVDRIRASEPDIPASVPDELATIIRRAMQPDPGRRFASVDGMRDAVRAFLEHRASSRLCEVADQRFESLRRSIECFTGEGDPGPIHAEFTECRFAYREALQGWPDNQKAAANLREAELAMIHFELARDEPHGARTLLVQMADPPPELAESVQRAVDERELTQERLVRLSRQHDMHIGWRTRTLVFAVLGVLFFLLPLGSYLFAPGFMMQNYPRAAQICIGLMLVMAPLVWWARDSLLKTALNRRLTLATLSVIPLQLIGILGGHYLGFSPIETAPLALYLWLAIATIVAVSTSVLLLPMVAIYAAAFLIAARYNEHTVLMFAIGNLGLLVNVAWYSLRVRDASDRSIRRLREPTEPSELEEER